MINNLLRLVVLLVTNFTVSEGKKYNNYSLYDIYPTEQFQLKFLQSLEVRDYVDAAFWTRPYKHHTHLQLMVNPRDTALFEERLHHYSMNKTVLTTNIQSLFDNQTIKKYTRSRLDTYSWNSYHNLEDIYQWMTDISLQHRNSVVVHTIGKSAEGREIYAIEIFSPKSKAKVMVDGAIHGNEWISTEFVTYLANALINATNTKNKRLVQIANKYNWTMVPVVNPDGYDYSIKQDRLWSKNRRKFENGIGVDLNKNFIYKFCAYGGSNRSDSAYYCGPHAMSEPETQTLARLIGRNKDKLKYYLSFRSYGQLIVVPYSDRIKHIDNYAEVENYGKQAILKMYKLNKVKYSVGTNYDVFGLRETGDLISWVKKNFHVKYAMSFYLRDNGTYGYALPPEKILPTCQETLIGLIELMTARHKHVSFDLFNAAEFSTSNLLLCVVFLIVILY